MGGSGTILKTIDGGATWITSHVSNHNLRSVYFTDTNTGYAVGEYGTILKTTNGGGYVGVNYRPSTSHYLKIYPNPTSDQITLETSAKGHLSILNLNGKQLLQQKITEPNTTVDVSGLKSGVYVVKMVGEKVVQVRKFVKR